MFIANCVLFIPVFTELIKRDLENLQSRCENYYFRTLIIIP